VAAPLCHAWRVTDLSTTTDPSSTPDLSAVTLVVTDLAASRAFYTAAFDAQIVFENDDSVVFGFGATLINLLLRSSADELLDPAPVGSPADASRIVFTVPVPDTDAYCDRLEEQGVTLLNGPMTRSWGPRTASFQDPDGHVWEIAS
jgi:lactoylglutathione lyase